MGPFLCVFFAGALQSGRMLSRAHTQPLTLRIITALAVLFLMLAGQTPLVAMAAQASAMECCKDGHACCRRAHHSHSTGPHWQAETCGMPGCCGAMGTVSVPLQAGAGAQVASLATLVALLPPNAESPRAISLEILFVLLQRPPPSSF
jgi:hypothetical protein